jgi:predicted P-loop ATPase
MKQEKKKKPKAEKEHKPNWREVWASVEDIQQFLSSKVMLRYNLVRGRTEIHWLSQGPVLREDERGLLSVFGGEEGVTDGYLPLSDRDVNTLWTELSREKPVRKQDLGNVIESDYVAPYHPFRLYLDRLPPWREEQGDNILALSLSVNVKGDADEQILFYEYLKKWLVAMVASWVSDDVVNNVMLVLIGEQGSYKTTWFSMLLPPELRPYFYTKTNSGLVSKDDLLTLAQYGLVCWEELDTMQPKELNKLKAAMTMPSINERAAYARYHENRPHLASFCGTGNNVQFLSDTTGTRRWLPFEVESIESPRSSPFDHDGIFAQAYALYKQGFRYWFEKPEIERLQRHNQKYEGPRQECELIDYYFRHPKDGKEGEYLPASLVLQIVGANTTHTLSAVQLGRAFVSLGFKYKTEHGYRKYHVVRRSPDELRMHRQTVPGGDGEDGGDVF